MIQAIEVLKRRKWLFIIAFAVVFVIPVLFGLLFMRSYESNSMIWLDSNASVASVLQQHGAGSSSESPIQGEANALRQLMQSREFVTKVISQTPLAAEMTTPRSREKTIAFVRKNTKVDVVGPNAVRVTFIGRSRDEAVTVAKVATSEFVGRVRRAAQLQSKKTTGLFADQSDRYSRQLEDANAALQAFRERHPETQQLDIAERVLTPPRITVSAAVQTEYARLKLAADYAQQLYDQSLSDLGQAGVISTLQEERYTTGFRTVDEPVAPVSFSKRRMLMFSFLAFVAAAIVAGLAVVWAESRDRTLHSSRDVERELDLPVLMEIPRDTVGRRPA
jgi:uncharacterized protein involved in exopolysaccharide biosynthesis